MAFASKRIRAVLPAWLVVCQASPGSGAPASEETRVSVVIEQPAGLSVVNNTPLQAALLTIAVMPMGVVVTASNISGGVGGGASLRGGATGSPASFGGGASGSDGGAVLAVSGGGDFGGAFGGATINGDAVSVSVGEASSGSATGDGRVPMIIAQYN
jgi:hypothetical protein